MKTLVLVVIFILLGYGIGFLFDARELNVHQTSFNLFALTFQKFVIMFISALVALTVDTDK